MTTTARASGLDVFAAKSEAGPGLVRRYDPAQLTDFLNRGLAVQLGDGHTAAVVTPADLNYWIAEAKAAYGKGTPEDSGKLRDFLTVRAKALGLGHLIGSWSVATVTATGKSIVPQLMTKARRFDALAAVVSDPGTAESYRQAAKAAREQALVAARELAATWARPGTVRKSTADAGDVPAIGSMIHLKFKLGAGQ